MTSRNSLLLFLILLIAAFLRFYNLMWGAPYFFNPDERNMASAVSQFRLPEKLSDILPCFSSELQPLTFHFKVPFPTSHVPPPNCNLNPHFFAYGGFPLYLAFFSHQIFQLLTSIATFHLPPSTFQSISFPQAIFWLRFWSAVSSTITVLIVYMISKQILSSIFKTDKRWELRDGKLDNEVGSGISRNLENQNISLPNPASHFSLLTSLLTTFTPGLIQSAHFGTTESLLTFSFMTIIYLSLKLVNSKHLGICLEFGVLVLFAFIMGLALATKLSALAFAVPFTIAYLFFMLTSLKRKRGLVKILVGLLGYCSLGLLTIALTLTIFFLTSPYNLLAWPDFRGTTNYEVGVATGAIRVFYTRQFEATVPILFQMEKIFPYALGPLIFLLGLIGITLAAFSLINLRLKPQVAKLFHLPGGNEATPREIVILLVAFLAYFIPNALIYAKWVRFMTPIFPLFAVFATIAIFYLKQWLEMLLGKIQSSKFKVQNDSAKFKMSPATFNFKLQLCTLHFALLTVAIAPGVAFLSIYSHEDVHVTASRWIYQNIPTGSHVLSETANVIDIPILPPNSPNSPSSPISPVSFDFYHLEEDPKIQASLIDELIMSDYIFVPSRRLFANTLRLSHRYPILNRYYTSLFSGELGFQPVATFTSFSSLFLTSNFQPPGPTSNAYLTFFTHGFLPDEAAEETWTVFDHPVIRIYNKTILLTKAEYLKLLNIN